MSWFHFVSCGMYNVMYQLHQVVFIHKMLLLSAIISTFAVSICADVPLIAWTSIRHFDNTEYSKINQKSSLIVENLLKNFTENEYKIIIFVEEFLAVEDFISRTSGNDNGIFNHLQDICSRKNCIFCPRVNKALSFLNSTSESYSVMVYNISKTININQCNHEILTDIINMKNDIIIIHMGDELNLTPRASLLKEHDKIMTEICTCIEEFNKFLCIYTGLNGLQVKKPESKDTIKTKLYNEDFKRTRRDTNYSEPISSRIKELVIDDSTVENLTHCEKNCLYLHFDNGSEAMVYVSNPPSLTYGNETYNIVDYRTSLRQVNDSHINLKLGSEETSIRFNFAKRSPWSWELTHVTADVESKVIPLTSDVPVKAQSGHSFFCQQTNFVGEETKLSLVGMQIEPVFRRTKRQEPDPPDPAQPPTTPPAGAPDGAVSCFGEAEHCIPFESIAVFMAYIVSCALILMLSWAVGMLQSVGVNVNFDGPEQKVLLRE